MTILGKFFKWVSLTYFMLKKETKRLVPVAIDVVEAVKKYMDSPASDKTISMIEAFLPPKVDVIVEWGHAAVHQWLPVVLLKLKDFNELINIKDLDAKVNAALNELKFAAPEVRKMFYENFSTFVLSKMTTEM
jgi:hypothetical protein